MATARTSTPTSEATTRAAFAWPVTASSASATTGNPSFRKMFQIPVTPTYRATAWPPNPHDRRIV
jgi:hypothetical protein